MKLLPKHAFLVGLALTAATSFAEDEAKKSDTAEKKDNTVKVSGIFEARGSRKISASTKQFTSLKIKKIVPHGTVVKKDQPIVWFETEAIDKQINDNEAALRLSEIQMEELAIELKQLGELSALEKESAKRSNRRAIQDYDYYIGTTRPQRIEQAEESLKSSRYSLENAMEELKQLEQMYKEDELTEESEEIVLKRAKRSVESATLRLKNTEISTKRALESSIPRESESQKTALAKAKLTYDKAIKSIDSKRQRRAIEIAEEKRKHDKKTKDFAKLREDRRRMVLVSPIAGVVYHGDFTRGAVSGKPSTLKSGSAATATQVLANVVSPKALDVRIDLPEKELASVNVGSKGKVIPTGLPHLAISGTVKKISSIPLAAGKFDCLMTIKMGKGTAAIVAGMTCSVEFEKPEKDGE